MTITIETPKGSHHKYKYEPRQEKFVLHKTLPGDMVFPFDFGFVPQTRGDDGDPLDILLLSEDIHQTGSQVNARIIGCLPAKQTLKGVAIRNDRFIGVPADEEKYATIHSIEQLPEQTLQDIQSFFITYLTAEEKQIIFLPAMTGTTGTAVVAAGESIVTPC